jgi:tRNA pseudouridine55 synthase
MFLGEIEQVPPKYSAININGMKAYERVRLGEEVIIPSRKVKIFDLQLCEINGNEITFKVHCSKGTYVRTLGEDIAKKLGYPGHLTMLKRTKVGSFYLQVSKDVNEVTEDDLISVTTALSNFKHYVCDEKMENDVRNGVKLKLNEEEDLLMVNKNNEALAIYSKGEDGYYHTVRGLF